MAAAARPYWTGFLKLSLVTVSVRLYTAVTERDRVRFHQIHEPSGERVRQQLIVPGIGPVERDDIVKGFEYQKGHYITVDPDDIKRLRLETTDTIDIVQFADTIDPIYFDTPYYLVPDGSVAEEGYGVIREALEATGKTAVGRVVINGQERVVAIRPLGTGLLGNSLRYKDEIRKPGDFFGTIPAGEADEDQLAIMEQIITRKTKPFDAGEFVDRYQTALRELIDEKLEGKAPAQEPERRPAQIINLMDALKRSLAEEDAAPSSRRGGRQAATESAAEPAREETAAAPRTRKAEPRSGQRNLLLPVDGGRGKTPRATTAKPAPEAAPAETPKRRRKAS